MRQALILLVVLIAGAAALWHFENERRDSLDEIGGVEMTDTDATGSRISVVKKPRVSAEEPGGATGEGQKSTDGSTGEPATDAKQEIGRHQIIEGEQLQLLGGSSFLRNPREVGEPRVSGEIGDSVALDNVGLSYDWLDLRIGSFRVAQGENSVENGQDNENLNYSLNAERARVIFDSASVAGKTLLDNLDFTAYGVVVEMVSGLPFSATKLEAPRLIVDLAIERLTSVEDDRVTFRSRDMHGSGVGFDARLQDGIIAFERGSDVELDLGEGRFVTIATPLGGPLTMIDTTPRTTETESLPATSLRREGPQQLEVSAEGGVHVELKHRGGAATDSDQLLTEEEFAEQDAARGRSPRLGVDEALVIDAASIEIQMTVHPGEEAPTIHVARADGAVTIRQGRDTYRGESARVFFENGEPARVVIETEPSLAYILREENGQEVELRMTGRGPITANLGVAANPTLGFVFMGPGRIEAATRGGVVTFENEARGRGVEDRSEAIVLLSGDVRVETPTGSMTSNALIATYRAEADLHAATDGSTLIIGRDSETGADYHLRADGGMTAHLSGDAWFVDRAKDVYAESFSDDPHRIRAGLITDVDVAAQTLSASGSILYESLWGRALSDKALVRTEETVTLIGSAEEPVQLDLIPGSQGMLGAGVDPAAVRSGWIRAEELRFNAAEIAAKRSVAAQVETLDGVWGFDSDELTVRRVVTGDALVLNAEGPEPKAGQFNAGQFEDVFIHGSFVRQVRYDNDLGNMVISADSIDLEAGAAGRDGVIDAGVNVGGSGPAIVDPTRSAVLRARGRVTVDTESYGAKRDANGMPTVEQTSRLSASSAVFERLPGLGQANERALFVLDADEVTECRIAGQGRFVELSSDHVTINGGFGALDQESPLAEMDLSGYSAVAVGSVDMRYRSGADQPMMRGRCHRLTLEDGVRGRMEADRGKRVRASGVVPGNELAYQVESTTVTFTREVLIAEAAEGTDVKVELTSPVRVSSTGMVINSVLTKKLTATADGITLGGVSIIDAVDKAGRPFRAKVADQTYAINEIKPVSSDEGDGDKDEESSDKDKSPRTIGPFEPVPAQTDSGSTQRSSDLELLKRTDWGPAEFEYPGIGYLYGQSLPGRDLLSGKPFIKKARLELEASGVSLDAEWLSLDTGEYTINAGRGGLRGGGLAPWTLDFAAIETTLFEDEVMFTITAPQVRYGEDSARADYLSVWLDRAKWEVLCGGAATDPSTEPDEAADVPTHRPNFLAEILFELQDRAFGKVLRALYLEGGVEVIRADRRAARGSKLYIDLPAAVAWLEDAELVYPLMSQGREVPLRVRTKRLGTDEEGRLTAENATLTTCDHDVPHFVVLTRKFQLSPRDDGRWRFGARGNKLKFTGGVNLPLPSIGNLVLDEEFGIEGFENEAGEVTPLRDIGIARTARFGTVLGAAFRFDVGDIGNWFAERIGMDSSKLRGKWDTEAQYLSGRGPQVGLGLQLRERKPGDDPDEDFRLDALIGGVLDDGEDRGSVRVDESLRDDLRITGHLRSRYPIVRGEWFDVAIASQTDAGVQSEFYEGDFLNFEQRDTFLRWRKSYGADYLAAGAQKRINSFRSQKEELPSFGAYRGERQVGTFTGVPVLWGGSFDTGYFRRVEGTVGQDLFSDLPGGAALGFGDHDTLRADLLQRISLPIQTTVAGIKATPFAELRGTAWSDSLAGGGDPRRGALFTGLELSTTLHKVTDNGYLHALAPRISYATDIANDQTGGIPVPLDATEAAIDGTRIEAGLRSLWQRPGTFENLDLDVRAIFRQDRDDGVADSSELGTLANYITRYGDGVGQIGIRHDARYNLEVNETTYSRSAFAIRPNDKFLVEFRYSQARDIFETELFETGGILGRWRLDPKWELESRYIHDLKNDQQLLTELTVRRYAHDFVFDITFQDRSGEGGTNLSFSLVPLLGWTAARIGILDRRDSR